jgi:hypothetical protein
MPAARALIVGTAFLISGRVRARLDSTTGSSIDFGEVRPCYNVVVVLR